VAHVNGPAATRLGVADHPVESTDLASCPPHCDRGLIGALQCAGGLPVSLPPRAVHCWPASPLGYLRTIGRPSATFRARRLAHEHDGLNVFIAIVGISAGPGFVSGLQQVGMSLFLWGMVATTIPLVVAVLLGITSQVPPGHPVRRLRRRAHDDRRARMIQEEAKSKVPALG